MAVIVPELTLYKIVNNLVGYIKSDYESNIDKTKTFLYRVFFGLNDHKKDYYVQAVDLFTRRTEDPRLLDVRLFFDANRAKIPTVHITMPSDSDGENSLSVDETGYIEDMYVDEDESTVTPSYSRRFDTMFQIVCTSDNHSEVLIMYHALRAGLISIFDTVSLEGLENAKLSGQELRIKSDLVPETIFMRGININCSYQVTVPRWWSQDTIANIFLCPNGQKIITDDTEK